MDYERDTTENGKSARRNWRRGKPTSNPSSDSVPAPPIEPSPAPEQPSGEIPTLFELPDCTSEGIHRRQEAQMHLYDLHRPHSGPPASHLDPPSGNFSKLTSPTPHTPEGTTPSLDIIDPCLANGENADHVARSDTFESPDQPPERIAAYHPDDPPKWADSGRSAWHTRAGIGVLVFALLTLSYMFGKRSHTPQNDNDATIAELTISEDDSVVMIADEILETPDAVEQVAADVSDAESSQIATAGVSPTDPTIQPSDVDPLSSQSTDDLLARIADAAQSVPPPTNASNEIVGAPPLPITQPSRDSLSAPITAPLSSPLTDDQTSAMESLNPESITEPQFGLDRSIDSVVSYRENTQRDESAAEHDEHDLPQGMADRLKLEDGLRYTDTPYPIGNFLEILKAWEASELR